MGDESYSEGERQEILEEMKKYMEKIGCTDDNYLWFHSMKTYLEIKKYKIPIEELIKDERERVELFSAFETPAQNCSETTNEEPNQNIPADTPQNEKKIYNITEKERKIYEEIFGPITESNDEKHEEKKKIRKVKIPKTNN